MASIGLVTFTGIDEFTDPETIAALSERYPRAEFGILVSGHSGDSSHCRYPAISTVEWWKDYGAECDIPMALHLCGNWSRDVMGGVSDRTLELCGGFGRVQVNAGSYDLERIAEFTEKADCGSVILQHRDVFVHDMPIVSDKVDYLHDMSGGRGIADFSRWPAPVNESIRHGYAGGVGPANIQEALKALSGYVNAGFRIWLDMESGVRDRSDVFDPDRALAVLEAVFERSDQSRY